MDKPNRDVLKMYGRMLWMQALMLLGIWVLKPAIGLTGVFLVYCVLASISFLIERTIQKKQKRDCPS